MTARSLLGVEAKIIHSAKSTVTAPGSATFVFGADDLDMSTISGFENGDRLLLLCTATTAGTTSSLTWVVEDDVSTAFSTAAAAITNSTGGVLAGGTGDDFRAIGVQLQSGRPWVRLRVTTATGTDVFALTCTVLALPGVI